MINRHLIILIIFSFLTVINLSAEKNLSEPAKSDDNNSVKPVEQHASDLSRKIIPGDKFAVTSPDELLGLSPEEAYEKMGVPLEIFPMRGEKEWQDDVVYYYSNHLYLFWFKNRVWQFRADKRFEGTILGLKTGLSRKEVNKILGKPLKNNNSSEIYLNPKNITRYETGFPVRMKVFYDDNNISTDIYIYRGDF